MAQTVTQRLMAVAIELEDERFAERRRFEQLHEDLSERLASMQLEKTEAQLAMYRLEEELLEERSKSASLQNALRSAEDEVDRLRSEEEDRPARDAHLDRINELMRELIATRFHLAAYVARDQSNGATAAASAAPWYPLQTSPGALLSPLACGADGLMKAVRALDVGATTAILSPGCVLAPSADTADAATSSAAEPASAEPAEQARSLDHLLGAALHACLAAGAPVGAAAAGEEAAGEAAGVPSSEALCTIAEALLLRGAPVEWAEPGSCERPLHAASRAASSGAASLLLEHGAEVNARDARGRAPLHHAVAAGSAEMVRYLLHHGAEAELRDAEGRVAEEGAAAAPGGDEARAALLGALRDPTLRLVAKAKAANSLYRAGEYAAATAAYAVALQISADHPEACADQDLATLHFNCARAALKEGRHLTALEQAARALERRTDYANARMLQAECHMELAEFAEAASAYAALCRIEPANPAWAECRLKASEMAEASLYDLLGVPPTAEPAELKKAYHHQCLKWHPDKHQGSAESRRRANNIFQRVTNAYEVLGAEARRAEYDLQRRHHGACLVRGRGRGTGSG